MGEDASSLEVFEVLVVSDDSERLSEALEVVSPEFDSSNYGEELLVVDIVVEFCRRYLSGIIGYCILFSIVVLLIQAYTDRVIRYICFYNNWLFRVKVD